jgi:thioredoxin reductase
LLPIDRLFVAIGHIPATSELSRARWPLDDEGYLITARSARRCRGVFAAGT